MAQAPLPSSQPSSITADSLEELGDASSVLPAQRKASFQGCICSKSTIDLLKQDKFRIPEGQAPLGTGSYCVVYKAKYKKHDVAVKMLDIWELQVKKPNYVARMLPGELDVIETIKHPHIVKTLKVYKPSNLTQGRAYIFMEMARCDLLTEIEAKDALNEAESKRLFKQICKAIEYLHNQKIAHRDIKPDNVLLDFKNNAKVTDFSFTKRIDDPDRERSRTFVGTLHYEAPEILLKQEHTSFPADVWALGCTLFVMLNNHFPFDDVNDPPSIKVATVVMRQQKNKYVFRTDRSFGCDVKDLVFKALNKNPVRRPRVHQLLAHEWFKHTHVPSKFNLQYLTAWIRPKPGRIVP